jgi:hypothetical protein
MNAPRKRHRHRHTILPHVCALLAMLGEIEGRKVVHYTSAMATGNFDMTDHCVTSTDRHNLLSTALSSITLDVNDDSGARFIVAQEQGDSHRVSPSPTLLCRRRRNIFYAWPRW